MELLYVSRFRKMGPSMWSTNNSHKVDFLLIERTLIFKITVETVTFYISDMFRFMISKGVCFMRTFKNNKINGTIQIVLFTERILHFGKNLCENGRCLQLMLEFFHVREALEIRLQPVFFPKLWTIWITTVSVTLLCRRPNLCINILIWNLNPSNP